LGDLKAELCSADANVGTNTDAGIAVGTTAAVLHRRSVQRRHGIARKKWASAENKGILWNGISIDLSGHAN
jgi:hypothetical protein